MSAERAAPRRVLQISQDLGVGGLERVVASLCRTMDRAQFEPLALCLREKGAFADELEACGIPVLLLPQPARGVDRLSFLKTAAIIREQRIDVVHSHNTDAFINAGLGALLSGRRVTVVHTDHARPFPDKRRYMVAEHLLSHVAHRVVGVSEHTTENLRRYEHIAERKLVTIRNGIEAARFDVPFDRAASRAALGIPAGAPLLGLGARLTDQKGVDVLLEAMPQVRAAVPDVQLVIAGDGPELGPLQARAQRLGLEGTVRFLGLRLDLPELTRTFDAFVIASRWEGLPMAMLEAMAARTPVVSTAVGGIPGVLHEGETGLLVPPLDPTALAGALVRICRDAALRARLATAARARFEEEFSAEVMTRRYEALYRGEGLPPGA